MVMRFETTTLERIDSPEDDGCTSAERADAIQAGHIMCADTSNAAVRRGVANALRYLGKGSTAAGLAQFSRHTPGAGKTAEKIDAASEKTDAGDVPAWKRNPTTAGAWKTPLGPNAKQETPRRAAKLDASLFTGANIHRLAVLQQDCWAWKPGDPADLDPQRPGADTRASWQEPLGMDRSFEDDYPSYSPEPSARWIDDRDFASTRPAHETQAHDVVDTADVAPESDSDDWREAYDRGRRRSAEAWRLPCGPDLK